MYRQLENRMGVVGSIGRGFVFAPDDGAGHAPEDDEEEEEEEKEEEEDEGGGEAENGATPPPLDLASLSDDDFKAEAIRRGVLSAGDPVSQKQESQVESDDDVKTPWDIATAEADAKLEAGSLGYADYDEYRSRRAFEITASQMREDQFDIMRPALIESYKTQFKSRGLPEEIEQSLVDIVPEMVDTLRKYPNGEGFANTPRGEQLRTVTAATIIGLKHLQKMVSAKDGGGDVASNSAQPGRVAPIRSTAGRETSEVREFLQQWANVHNGGKTPDAKQVARLKAEYPSIFEEVK